MKEKIIKSYKAFDSSLSCSGFQYELGKEYKMKGHIECGERGFNACESPLEVFDHYDMLKSRFAEVEQSGIIDRDENTTKVCSSRIRIKAELKLADIINIGIEWLKDITSLSQVKTGTSLNDNGERRKQMGSSGDYAQMGSSADYVWIGSNGLSAKIGSSGDYVHIGSSGYSAKISSSGNFAQIGSSGDYSQIGSSGNFAQIGSCGDSVKIGSSGDSVEIGSSGNSAQIGSLGNFAQIGSSGDFAKIGSFGDFAQISSSGKFAKIDSTGSDSVIMCAGCKAMAKAKIGSWITLSEWVYSEGKGRYVPVCVKTEYVDGENIKADTYYQLIDGVFTEVNK
jgi:hypothetical protein